MTDEDWTRHPAAARLLGVHALLRRELGALQHAVADLESGTGTVRAARSAVNRLAAGNGDINVRDRCLLFCDFLHTHHYMEDEIFPQLAAVEPQLRPVVERLIAEHAVVAKLITGIRVEVNRRQPETSSIRSALVELTEHLDAHLGYEEEHIGPALARLG